MITPSYGLTATERVLPSFTLDWTTGLVQSTVDVTRAGVATFIGSDGLLQSASADTQRIDYSTGVAGLLVEESRTNLLTYSEDFSNAVWNVKTNVTVTPSATVDPAGGTNAFTIRADANSVNFGRIVAGTAGSPYSFPIWIRRKTGSGNIAVALGDLSYEFITAQVTSEWKRINVTKTPSTTTVRVYLFLGTSGDEVEIFGAQLEAGAFPTSYIPTEASAVTRNADVASVTGTNFSDFFNATEGTFGIEAYFLDANALAADRKPLFYAGDGVSNVSNVFEIGRQENNGNPYMRAMTYSGGATQTSFNMGLSTGQPVSAVMGYKVDSVSGAINGNNPVSDTSATMPVGIDQLRLGSNTTIFMSGWVRSFRYWPQRLINNEIRAFSK
jgi:hypothetical protein